MTGSEPGLPTGRRDISMRRLDAGVEILLTGELDHHNAALLRTLLATLVSERTLVLDLTAVTFMDAGGVNAIVGAHRRLREAHRELQVRAPAAGGVARVLEITGVNALLGIERGERQERCGR